MLRLILLLGLILGVCGGVFSQPPRKARLVSKGAAKQRAVKKKKKAPSVVATSQAPADRAIITEAPTLETPAGANQVEATLSATVATPLAAPTTDAEVPGVSPDGFKVAPETPKGSPK